MAVGEVMVERRRRAAMEERWEEGTREAVKGVEDEVRRAPSSWMTL